MAGARTRPRFPLENRFSDGKNEANRLARGVKPRATLKAVFRRVARNAPPGRFVLAYLVPLPKSPRAIAFGFFILAGARTRPRFPLENRFSDGKNEANRLARGVKPRATLKAVFRRVARNAPPGRFVLAYLVPLPKSPRAIAFGFFILAGARTRPRFPAENGVLRRRKRSKSSAPAKKSESNRFRIFYFGRGTDSPPFSCKLIFSGRYDILLQKQRSRKRA